MERAFLDTLEGVEEYFSGDEDSFGPILQQLGGWLSQTGKDEDTRKSLANSKKAWDKMETIFGTEVAKIQREDDKEGEVMVKRLRMLRGLTLIVRNIAVEVDIASESQVSEARVLVSTLGALSIGIGSDIGNKTFTAVAQCLANILTVVLSQDADVSATKVDFDLLDAFSESSCLDSDAMMAVMRYLSLLATSEQFISDWITDDYDHFKQFVMKVRTAESTEEEDSWLTTMWLKIMLSVISNPYLLQTLQKAERDPDPTFLIELERQIQILCGSSDSIDNEALLTIASSLMEFVKGIAEKISAEDEVRDADEVQEEYKDRLARALDCISSLLQYGAVKKVLNSYSFIDTVLQLFRLASKKKRRDNFDEAEHELDKDKAGVKCILLEIISYMVDGNFGNQEKVREKQCLGDILNSTNLDLDEPYIRERAILCLKSLLAGNQKNQDFIANMEGKGMRIDKKGEEMLDEAGYEIELHDGKVKLKSKSEVEPNDDNTKVTEIE